MRLSTVIGCLLYIIVLFILDVRYGIADGASTSQPAVIGFINISSQNKGVNAVIDLLSTNLTKNPMIQLVEREQLDIALKELELAAAEFENRKTLLKLGQLIRADGLGLVSLSEDGKILRVRLVDTKYGFRLLDTRTEWDEKNLEGIVEEIVTRLAKVAPKLIIPPEKEVLVGILSIRNIDPSSTLNWLELALPGLISSRLSSEPRVIVLERENLNVVLEEKLFTQGTDSSFLGSMVLLEGEVEQLPSEENHRFTLTLHTKQADGKSIGEFKIEGDTEKLPLLTESIARWAVKEITDSPPQRNWDIKSETERFLKEGQVLIAHNDWASARPLIETACALDPGNSAAVETFVTMWSDDLRSTEHSWSGHGRRSDISPLERAQIVSRIVDLLTLQFQRGMEPVRVLTYLESVWSYLNKVYSVETEDIKVFNRQTRRYCEDLSKRAYILFEKDSVQWYWKIRFPLGWGIAVSETPEEAIQRVREGMSRILIRPEKGGYLISDEERIKLLSDFLLHPIPNLELLQAGHLDKEKVRNLWTRFLTELTQFDDPIIKIMAELCLLKIFRDNPTGPEFNEHYKKTMKILFGELNYPNEPLTLAGRYSLRFAIGNVAFWPHIYRSCPEIWIEKVDGVLKPLLEKSDVENLILWNPRSFFYNINSLKCDSAIGERILSLFDGIIKTLENMDRKSVERIVQSTNEFLSPSEQVDYLKLSRVGFLRQHPEIKPDKVSSSGLKVKILCEPNKLLPMGEWRTISYSEEEITREGEILWISLGPWSNNEVWLIGINLEEKSLSSFWRASIPSAPAVLDPLTRPVVGEDATYVGVWGVGIVRFPGTSRQGIERLENPEAITEKDGLPSNYISDIARVGNRLYVSVGGMASSKSRFAEDSASGFGIYDLEKREWKTISSSRSKDRPCPLNVEEPYKITSLTPTSDEKKLFFICEQLNGQLHGLWKMDIESGKLEHIWKGGFEFADIVPDEGKWWIRGQNTLISFDPDSETGEVVVGDRWGNYKYIAPGEPRYKPPSMEKVYIPNEPVHFWGWKSGLFKDVYWVLTGSNSENIPYCIFIDEPNPKIKKLGIDILGEDYISGLYPTPYGVVIIGENKIGLIEENPEP